ncbi:MAG: ATP-binding protein [Candidatus Omnitrophota bacterium]
MTEWIADRFQTLGEGNADGPDSTNGPNMKAFESTRKALLSRPKFSIRLQIYISFVFSFTVILGFAIAQLAAMQMMKKKVVILDAANNALYEIQHALSFQNDFFLYGAGLDEALASLRRARSLLQNAVDSSRDIGDILGDLLAREKGYESMLKNRDSLEKQPYSAEKEAAIEKLDAEIRTEGKGTAIFGRELILREKKALQRMIGLSQNIHAYSLFSLLLIILFFTFLLTRRILARINRFVKYTQRIALGNYTLIIPARSYRDEFSDLAVAINRMIMELKLRQDILVQSHKLKAIGALTAGVAHELNNPLNNIMLTAHMFKEDYPNLSDEERQEMMEDVIHESERAKKIVSNLLDFARESHTVMAPLDIGGVIRETLDLAANQINLKGAHIDLRIESHLPVVNGDKQQLIQVFLNVIFNALDVTPKGGRIVVDVGPTKTAKFLTVKVTDFGPGIPDHVIPSIFDPFFTTKSKQGGTGLGLSVSQGIVAKHGGEISAYSEPNAGTTFTVALPAASPHGV